MALPTVASNQACRRGCCEECLNTLFALLMLAHMRQVPPITRCLDIPNHCHRCPHYNLHSPPKLPDNFNVVDRPGGPVSAVPPSLKAELKGVLMFVGGRQPPQLAQYTTTGTLEVHYCCRTSSLLYFDCCAPENHASTLMISVSTSKGCFGPDCLRLPCTYKSLHRK